MYLETPLQQYLHKSKYSRYLDSANRRESWEETVDRYMNFANEHISQKYGQAVEAWGEVSGKIKDSILKTDTMPSMRLLMTAGEAVKKENMAAYNCFYASVNKKRRFSDTLYILLAGTGVGFSCEKHEISRLPKIPDQFIKVQDIIVVRDSKKGWAIAYRKLIDSLYHGEIPIIDYSKIRPAGSRLKTFGGRASGPWPLKMLFEFTVDVFKQAHNRKLTSLEVHDIMCKIAEVVVVGGVRRSALMSLSTLSDRRMREAKAGLWWEDNQHRALANNSAVYTEKPDKNVFIDEWSSLVDSKSGERGIFNRQAAQKQAAKYGKRPENVEYGCNPCCVTGDTKILTDNGHIPIIDTVGKPTVIWNGKEWSEVEPFFAGNHQVFLVTLSDGSSLEVTGNHKWVLSDGYTGKTFRVTTDELVVGDKLAKFSMPVIIGGIDPEIDAYSQGFYSGDGLSGHTHSHLYKPKYTCQSRLIGTFSEENEDYSRKTWKHGKMLDKGFVPVSASLKYCLNWLSGILDSDGTVTRDKNGNGFQICSIDHKFLLDIKLMLTRMGVRSKIVGGAKEGMRPMPDGHGGVKEYFCNTIFRLLIGNQDTYHLGKIGLKTERLEWHNNRPQRDARQFVSVVSVEPMGMEDVYCFEEPLNHTGTFNGVVTGQSEILLHPEGQTCNLTEVVVRSDDTLQSLLDKIEICTILGTYQCTLTDFDFVDPKIKEMCEKERLLGVSMTGVMDHQVLNKVNDEAAEWLTKLRNHAEKVNEKWAKIFEINKSSAITCVKPSGSVSVLTNAGTGGLHPRFSQYYIRNVRQDNKDPLTDFLKKTGIPWEPDAYKPYLQTVFSFVVKGPENAVFRNDRTAIEQLEHWLMFQNYFCDHKPSITVYVRDEEWDDVGSWVYDNFDEISGVAFLPFSDHVYKQAPFIPISEEEYNVMVEKFPKTIDWDSFVEYDDMTEGSQELACTGGSCSIL